MKVYTRKGDRGDTALFGGAQVRKDHLRVEAYGAVDELNAVLGMAAAELGDADLLDQVRHVQSALFDLGAELATPDLEARERRGQSIPRVRDADVEQLERWIDGHDAEIEPLKSFVLPGGVRAAAHLHHARTVCRRAERRVVAIPPEEPVSPTALRYLNRLSDLLFTLARVANRRAGVEEPRWVGRER